VRGNGEKMVKKKSRRSGKSKIPLAIAVPMAVPAIEAGRHLMAGQMTEAQYVFTGVDINGKIHANRVAQTYAPMVVGVLVHKFAGRYVNRYIPKWLPVGL